MENSEFYGACIVGKVFVSLEILIIIGKNLGWISYNMEFESFLFIILLIFIVSYQDKNQNKKTEVKKFE